MAPFLLMFQEFLGNFSNIFEDFKKTIIESNEKKDEVITALTEQCTTLERELKTAKNKIDDADQYERKDSVILTGPAVKPMEDNENTHELVQNLLKDQFDIEINKHDINITHRLGPIKASTPKQRNIYVKFVRRDVKRRVVQKSRELGKEKGKNSPLHANESLTPLRRKIHNTLRQMKKDVPDLVKGCTTLEGKVFVFTPPVPGTARDQRHFISDWDTLQDFCRDFIKQPLDNFLQNFS